MRRRPEIGGLQTAVTARDQYRLLRENVVKIRTDLMKEQLATFRTQLEDFARKHKDQYRLLRENVAKIRTDLMKEQLATFRTQLEDFAR